MSQDQLHPVREGDALSAEDWNRLRKLASRRVTGPLVVETSEGWHIRRDPRITGPTPSTGIVGWAKITAYSLIPGETYRYYYSGVEMEPTATGYALVPGGRVYTFCILNSPETARTAGNRKYWGPIVVDTVVALLGSFVENETTYYYCQVIPPIRSGWSGTQTVVTALYFDATGCLEAYDTKDLEFENGLLLDVT